MLLSACTPASVSTQEPVPLAEIIETPESELVEVPAEEEVFTFAEAGEDTSMPSSRPTLAPDLWTEMPVVPQVSDTARDIYRRGLEMGNDPQVFSKVGDCQNVTSRFLGVFDHPDDFTLGLEYAYLQETIGYFSGSFSRDSLAVKGGNQPATVLTPLHADKEFCNPGESPFECEIRVNNPSFVIISLEAWGNRPIEIYEGYLRQIVEHGR